jgi:Peptidase family S41
MTIRKATGVEMIVCWHRVIASAAVAWFVFIAGTPATARGQQSDSSPVGQVQASASAGALRFSPDALRTDFQILRRALETGSPGLYRHTSKPAFDQIFAQTEATLDRPLTALEFYRQVAPVVAAIKNGHTQLRIPTTESEALDDSVALIPLGVRVLRGKIYVVRDFSGQTASLAGLEIRAINGVAAPEVIARLLRAVSADGDVTTSRERVISGLGFIYRLFSVLGWSGPFAVTVHDPATPTDRNLTLHGRTGKDIEAAWRLRYPADVEIGYRRPFELRFSDADAIAILVIPHWDDFVDAKNQVPIATFFQQAFQTLQQRKTRALIIDVRDDPGGEDTYGTLLVSYLLDAPFEYFSDIWMKGLAFDWLKYGEDSWRAGASDSLMKEVTSLGERGPDGRIHLTKRPNWGPQQQPLQPGFRGRVYVLINGGSFSTSAEFSTALWTRRRAQFVGEEASGYWRSDTSGPDPTLTLPATKVRLLIPLVEFDMPLANPTPGSPGAHGVMPDYPVVYSVSDLLAGTDKDTELALRLARTALTRSAARR